MITVRLYGPLRRSGAGELRLPAGLTVREALTLLERERPELTPWLRGAAGGLPPHVVVLRDGRNVALLQGLDTTLPAGSTLSLIVPIEGG